MAVKPTGGRAISLAEARRRTTTRKPRDGEDRDGIPPEFTDEALALDFTRRHGKELRYVAAWGKWLEWDGARWKPDGTLRAFDLARAICREAAARAGDQRVASRCASAATVAAVERLARADRQHAATSGIWDADPWLLNTPGGVVDLRSGKTAPPSPALYLTKITAAAAGGECPSWRRFLGRVTDHDEDLQDFLRRVAGYCLTGSTRDHALFFAYGTGGNGKGVFINTLSRVLGDYAAVAPMETFTASATEQHPTDLAGLRGARLVTAQETEDGRRWAESKIKSLTGGDPITARFMRQDFFTFEPQFKLLIAGNHKPGLRNVDEAVRRRFHLLPFTVRIPTAEQDKQLPDRLLAEASGILTWAIQGCLEWQRIGLAPPDAVRAATDEYLEAEDGFGLWMAECLRPQDRWQETSADLFASWKIWAERAGEYVGSQKKFSQTMETRGAAKVREGGTGKMAFEGFRIVRHNYADDLRYGG